MLRGAVFGDAPDPTANLHVAVRIVGIDDRQRHSRAGFKGARLDPPARGVHSNDAVGVIEPDRRHLR